jgi:hypothetical protein
MHFNKIKQDFSKFNEFGIETRDIEEWPAYHRSKMINCPQLCPKHNIKEYRDGSDTLDKAVCKARGYRRGNNGTPQEMIEYSIRSRAGLVEIH